MVNLWPKVEKNTKKEMMLKRYNTTSFNQVIGTSRSKHYVSNEIVKLHQQLKNIEKELNDER